MSKSAGFQGFSSLRAPGARPPRSTAALVATALCSSLFGFLLAAVLLGLPLSVWPPSLPAASSAAEGEGSPKWLSARYTRLEIPGLEKLKIQKKDFRTAVWPMPFNVSHGSASMLLSPDLEFVSADGTPFPPILAAAAQRYRELVFQGRRESLPRPEFRNSQTLLALEIRVLSPSERLFIGVDESYSLRVPDGDRPGGLLEAKTVYGALRGLETFSQLCKFDFNLHAYRIDRIPWIIYDKPRFHHRGLLVDTARHFQPMAVLERILDAMSYSKLNVLHWHMVDQQAFPIEIPSFPLLWKGAYSEQERYTVGDIARVVKLAAERGIVVVPEIDVPGHAEAWGVGYPDLWPGPGCRMPLDVSRNFTFDVIRGILRDLKAVIPYSTVHLGGDEVDWGCWQQEQRVASWLREQDLSPVDAYEYFVHRAREIAEEEGWETVILWEETFQHFGQRLNSSVIVENWLNRDVKEGALAAGLRVLVSLVGEWYLDHQEHDWWSAYNLEPCGDLRAPRLCELIVGGETCMWTEHADPSNIVTRIWPRAASVSERLWSPRAYTQKVSKQDALHRIMVFKCLLHQRGISANYVNMTGWTETFEPGSCYHLR